MAPGDRWFFDRIAPVYDLAMPPAAPGPLRDGLALAEGPVERVLDVGGGTGRAAAALGGYDRVVVDVSLPMLRRVSPGIERVRASATDLPVADGSVDAVVIVDALHHLPRHHRVVAEAFRALRPGGVLVVRDFNRATRRGRLVEFVEHAVRMESTFLTAAAVRDRLSAGGFERPTVLHDGFWCTVAGRKPGEPSGARAEADA